MAKIYRKRGNKLNEVVTFDSACTRQENQPLVYDATDGSVHTTTHIGCLDADDVSINNLTVTGQAIIQEQVTDTIGSNTLVLRSNAEAGLAGSENSGIIIHNYNGSADLYAVTDNTGTFRVGTAVSTTTTYPYLRYNKADNKWYSTAPGVTPAVEVTPVGSPTSWDSVVTSGDDVEYTNIVFSVIDRTSLQPLTTRDESTAMEKDYLTKWNSTNDKIITTGTSCTHDLCANGDITSTGDITADGNVCVKTNITVDGNSCLKGNSTIDGNSCVKGTSTVTGEIHSCKCITAPTACVSDDLYVAGDINNCNTDSIFHGFYGCFEKNVCIKGDLSVDGFATISGLMSDYVATVEDTTTNDWEYLTFVPTNHLTKGRNSVYTDGDLKYNPYSNTLNMGNACVTDTACITCACVGNECVNNLCIGTVVTNGNATESATYCVSSITGNTDYAIPLYNKNITNVNSTKKAELSYVNQSDGPRYNPNTNTFCVHCVRAAENVIADDAVVTCCIVSSLNADLAAGASKNIVLDARCKNSSGTLCSHATTFCGTDGKIYNNYGICSTAQLNGLNTPVTTSLYSATISSGYIYLGCARSISSAGNHDITLSGTAYIYMHNIVETTKFSVTLRGNGTNLSIRNLYVDKQDTRLKFTSEVNGNVYTIRVYYQLASSFTRATLKIDYAGSDDEGTQVPPASVWKPNTGTIVVNAMTGTEIYKSVFPGSCVAYASCAGVLQDHYNGGFSAYLYNGELSGVCKFNNNICLYNVNYNSFCALEGFSCVGVLCQGLGTYQYPSRWLSCTSSSRSIGIFNPALDINERGYIPTISSMNAVDSNYKVLGFSLGAYRGRCEFEGAYFGVYRPYNNGGTVGCNCLRAVMNWHNCVCCSCTTQAGTWMCDSMIELIDSQGGQTINGRLCINDIIDYGHVSACHNCNFGYLFGDGHAAAFTVWNDIVNCPASKCYVSALSQLSANNNWFSLGVLSGFDCWGITHSGGGFIATINGNGDISANVFCGGCASGFTIANCTTGGSVYLGSTSVAIGDASWQGYDCCNVAIGYNTCACGARSIGIGTLSSAAQTSVAIGACSNALTGNSVAIGTCSCSQTYAVAIGCKAKATYYSVSIGCAADSSSDYGVAIGPNAKNCVQSGIAIGSGANTSGYGSACVLVDERAGGRMRRSIICWNTSTKQCDLFCAIYCRFNFNYYDNSSTVYVGVTGTYGNVSLNEIKWDKNESPMNFDLGRHGFTNVITVYSGCTSTIPKAGYVQIVGYVR